MTGAIAHDVDQPLTAVTNYKTIRASEVVRRLRDFFRAGTTRLEVVEVEDLLCVGDHNTHAGVMVTLRKNPTWGVVAQIRWRRSCPQWRLGSI